MRGYFFDISSGDINVPALFKVRVSNEKQQEAVLNGI